MKKLLLAAMLASSLGAVALPAVAARVVFVEAAPPPPRVESVPQARRGYLWVGGHWEYRGHRHVWVKGTWKRERKGQRYVAPTWVEEGGKWRMEAGRWARGDRDGDGVPNNRDAQPDNPNRR